MSGNQRGQYELQAEKIERLKRGQLREKEEFLYFWAHFETSQTLMMSQDQVDSVVCSVESLLAEAAQMQAQCREQSEQLAAAAAQLREESQSLREQCEATQLDMARMRRQLEELLDTKAAFEARERQSRKLSKQL
ncbi:hypothetical protein AAFF_G00156990 [Aldrovandia affinis]|uniref:Uncharacterized protein n=1 Tax=Aldrovandia affinis TaxID=143900 RepID=A0AAD7W7V6_9TELE|nr:hypothetical protein AAFF_G00156990 [Aldrovandia affinis]